MFSGGPPITVLDSAAAAFVNAETTAWRARLGTAVSDTWANSVDAFFTAIKTGAISGANIFAKCDVIVIPAHAANNWINIVKAAHDPGALGGAPVFGSGGWTFDGVDDEMTTNFNPTTSAGTYTQTAAHCGLKTASKTAAASYPIGWFDGTDGLGIDPRNGANDVSFRINQASGQTYTATMAGTEHVLANRSGNTTVELYVNGADVAIGADQTATTLNNANYRLGTDRGTIFAACLITDYSLGGSLTANEAADLHNALTTLRAASGAP